MKLTTNAKKKDSFFLNNADLMKNDQDFITNFINFMDDESVEKAGLNENVRQLAIISGLVGSNALDLYKELLPTALKAITPEVVKEILYQGVSYLGINQVYPFLKYTNSYYQSHHIKTNLESTHLQNNEERRQAGLDNLKKIYGKAAQDYPNSGNKNLKRMRELVTDNGFGDYYSRQTVSMETRELITFCLLEGLGGHFNSPLMTVYGSTKFAVRGITQAAAWELGKKHINVNAYCPGIVDTPMWKQIDADMVKVLGGHQGDYWKLATSMISKGRPEKPQDVADFVSYLASPKSDYMNGQAVQIDGGMTMI